jgi:hypothetical protein
MSIEAKQKQSRDPEARADVVRQTVRAYADDATAFTRDLSRAESQIGNSHLAGSKECNCGLCGAVARADLSEVLASAHLIGEQACGCARCMALAALADEAACPGPGTPRLDVAELQRKVDGDEQPAAPGAQPGAQPAAGPAAHAGIEGRATAGGGGAAADVEMSSAEVAAVAAEVAAEFAATPRPNEAYLGALASLFSATAEMAAYAGSVSAAKPAGFPGTLGLTSWSYGSWTYPSLALTSTERAKPAAPAPPAPVGPAPAPVPPAKEWVTKIGATTVADATHSCVASPAGKHKYTTQSLKVKGVPTTFNVQLEITPGYHTKISDAEQEHLNDLLLAYNLSIKAAGDAVNSLVAAEYVAATQTDAETAAKAAVAGKLHASLTASPATWRSQLIALCGMTISGRDGKGWHTFGLVNSGPTVVVDPVALTITHGLDDGTTSINTAGSPAVVHF